MASKTLSKDQQNFIWISIACVDFLKLPLKDILDNQIKPADLYQRIDSSPTNVKYFLKKEQENICFIPPPGLPDYNDFDVTLLYTLIRNLCSASLNPISLNPTRGWGKVPNPSHMRIGDDIERLRLMRNMFAHVNSAGIPDAEFQVHWNELKSVIRRIQTFMNSMGSNVNYVQKLADIERNDFGYGDLQKYKLFLEATLNQLKKERIKDEPEILITGADRVVWGEKTCFEADLKQKETYHWSISWQKVRGSVTNQIDISKEKYRDSTRTQLVIHSVSKDDEGEYQAVLARESNGNKRKIESNAIFLHVMGDYEDYIAAMVLEESQGSDFIIPDTTSLPYTSSDSLNANTLTSDHPVDTKIFRVDMQRPIVLSALETGVDRNVVKTVIERRLRETGEDFPNVQELMDAVLAFESNTRYSNVRQGISRLPVPLDASPGNACYRTQAAKLAEENRQLRQQKVCKVCLDAEIGIVFLPCGHLCCCQACAPNVGQCPVCRANIINRVHLFIP